MEENLDMEKYIFDLNGYIIVRNVLTIDEIAICNDVIHRKLNHIQERIDPMLKNVSRADSTLMAGDGKSGRKDLGGILEWGEDSKIFRSILDHPKLKKYFHLLLGRGYRMDHLPFVIAQDKGSEGFSLHGGSVDIATGHFNPYLSYQCINGTIHNNLLACSVVLTDHNANSGGFCIVKGSHKSNFNANNEFINGIGKYAEEFIYQPLTKAGDVILFSEGTVHGALAWNENYQRRVALYRFAPATSCYGRSYFPSWPEKMLEDLTPSQKAVLEPPYNTRLDRPILSNDDDSIEICQRNEIKRNFDNKVFGTKYF